MLGVMDKYMLTHGRSCQNSIGTALIPMSLQALTNVCASLPILVSASRTGLMSCSLHVLLISPMSIWEMSQTGHSFVLTSVTNTCSG